MKNGKFVSNGTIFCRGEEVSKYTLGESVSILEEISENTLQVIIREGESKGTLLTVDKDLLIIE